MKKLIISLLCIFVFIALSIFYKSKCVSGKNNDFKELLNAQPVNSNQFVLIDEYEDESKKVSKADQAIDFSKDSSATTSNRIIYRNRNSLDGSELYLLARLIESEAGCEEYYGKLAVGSVVMNRINMDGEGLTTVIFKKNQFDGIHTASFNADPSKDSLRAAEEILKGNNVIPQAYYYANLKLCNPSFAKKDKFLSRIGDHWFFKK